MFNGNLCSTIDKESTQIPKQQNRKAMSEKANRFYGVKMIAITATECVAKEKKQ